MQVGFTTDPRNSRSTEYCSDLGKTFEVGEEQETLAPVLPN